MPILLLEDDYVDAFTIQRAFEDLGIKNPIIHQTDGEKGLSYLKDHEDTPPLFILLDLNMPIMNGLEFLKLLKEEPTLRMIPVIILTTSKQDTDKSQGFSLGAAGFMIKPIEYQDFLEVVKVINAYWQESELPFHNFKTAHEG